VRTERSKRMKSYPNTIIIAAFSASNRGRLPTYVLVTLEPCVVPGLLGSQARKPQPHAPAALSLLLVTPRHSSLLNIIRSPRGMGISYATHVEQVTSTLVDSKNRSAQTHTQLNLNEVNQSNQNNHFPLVVQRYSCIPALKHTRHLKCFPSITHFMVVEISSLGLFATTAPWGAPFASGVAKF